MTTRTRTSTTPSGTAEMTIEDDGEGTILLVDDLAGRTRPQRAVRTLVAMPAYNEGLVIGSVVLQARKHADRVIVVDDGSSDRTAETARLAGADVIRFEENGRKARATRLLTSNSRKAQQMP